MGPLEGGGVAEVDEVAREEEEAEGVDEVEAVCGYLGHGLARDEDELEAVDDIAVEGFGVGEYVNEVGHDILRVHLVCAAEGAVELLRNVLDRAEAGLRGGLAEDALVDALEVGRRDVAGRSEGEEHADEPLGAGVGGGVPPGGFDGLGGWLLAVLEDELGDMVGDELVRVHGADPAGDQLREGLDELGAGVLVLLLAGDGL